MKTRDRSFGFALRIASACCAISLVACSDRAATTGPQEAAQDTICTLDGMILADFPGPKGQIQYEQGPPDFFCDTMEMVSIFLRPEQTRRVVAIYTQDMGRAKWEEPRGHWIDARAAFYVHGSSRHGSMGPTLGSFARAEDAQAFAARYGGKVLRFDEITLDMVALDGGVLRDEQM
jgi:copper chaperone NosL